MLERSAAKVARCVLRGERSREAPDLPGARSENYGLCEEHPSWQALAFVMHVASRIGNNLGSVVTAASPCTTQAQQKAVFFLI